MSRHWVPDESEAVRQVPAPVDVLRLAPAPPKRARLPEGGTAGLLLVAAVCAGIVIGLNALFGQAEVFAEEAAEVASLVTR